MNITTDYEKEKFFRALSRLYDTSMAQAENIRAISGRMESGFAVLTERMDELSFIVKDLAQISRRHEDRLDRTEVTVEAILEDLRHHREGRSDLPGRPT